MTKNFKILSIMPLRGCASAFRKNLEIGVPLKFFQDYDIIPNSDGSGIKTISRRNDKINHDHLYELSNGISVQFSAIVGKNGSGKSTVIELLYYLVYLIGTRKKSGKNYILSNNSEELAEQLDLIETDITTVDHLNLDEDSQLQALFTIIHRNQLKIPPEVLRDNFLLKKYTLQELINLKGLTHYNFDKAIKNERDIRNNFAVSLLYEIGGEFRELRYYQQNILYKNHTRGEEIKGFPNFDLENFFYSISLNYSHHGLNSETIGTWINRLFHKNDAYRTPVVINPMRTKGNFDINKELSLSKERLMANLVYELVQNSDYLLLEKYKISKFIFRSKMSRPAVEAYTKEYLKSYSKSYPLLKKYGIYQINDNYPFWDLALPYLERKLQRIRENYAFLFQDQPEEVFHDFLKNDSSHITKKVRQTLNFLRTTKNNEVRNIWKREETLLESHVDFQQMMEWLKLATSDEDETLKNLPPHKLIEFALPGFFNVDFEFTFGQEGKNEKILFREMSSGEQQQILNQNSILYHLYNLDSIGYSHGQKSINESRITYSNINIVLDEMELYYHPEWQKNFLLELHRSFEKLPPRNSIVNGIKNINVMILTHSPFILSDIPSSHILKLDNGKPQSDPALSFAANVYDILADSFFLNDSSIGSFAESKIREVVKWIESQKDNKEIDKQAYERIKGVIAIIEEPVLRNKLTEMLYEIKIDNAFLDEMIEKETSYLRNLKFKK